MNSPDTGSEDLSGRKTLEIFAKAAHFNKWLYKSFASYCHGNILEIGSGTGNISRLLLKEGNSITLSDINPDYCKLLASTFVHEAALQGVYPLDLSDPEFANKNPQLLNQYDTIVGLNVVEHIKDEQMVIRNASKMLRYKGRIIILVPAYQGIYNTLDQSLGHYRRYTRKKLVLMLQSEGLELIRSKYFNTAGIAGWWFFGSVLKKDIIPSISLKIFDIMVPLLKILDWISFRKIGLSVVAIAEKT